jgi:hypothetical protein
MEVDTLIDVDNASRREVSGAEVIAPRRGHDVGHPEPDAKNACLACILDTYLGK